MKGILRNISLALLCGALAMPVASAQGRHEGATNGGRGGHLERTNNNSRPNRGNDRSHNTNRGNANHNNNSSRPNTRPGNNGSANHRPGINASNGTRPGITERPGNNKRPEQGTIGNGGSNTRPGHNTGTRPGINNNQNRPNHGNNNRPDNGNNHKRPGINDQHRPGNGNNGMNHGNRPADNHHRPEGMRPGNNNRPTGGRPGINESRPGHNSGSHRPGNQHGNRPGLNHGHRPGMHPGNGHVTSRPPMIAPPHRPHRPPMVRPHHRPMPPRGWRPAGRIPVIRGVIGLTFGTTIGLSLDYLFNAGYNVDGYTDNIVYLRNVAALNYVWTDAALYYGNSGLDASSFYYSTPVYDLARYNNVYNSLVATYGMPVSVNNTMGSLGATWFGGNNGYITLTFGQNNIGPGIRYLTTLTFGM